MIKQTIQPFLDAKKKLEEEIEKARKELEAAEEEAKTEYTNATEEQKAALDEEDKQPEEAEEIKAYETADVKRTDTWLKVAPGNAGKDEKAIWEGLANIEIEKFE